MLVVLLILAFLGCVAMACATKVSSYTGVVVGLFGKPWRSKGSGLLMRIPFVETIERVVSLKTRAIQFASEFEPQNEEAVPLKMVIEYHPEKEHLVKFASFDESKIEEMLKDRVKSILSIIVRTCKGRDDVMDSIKTIAEIAKEEFELSFAEDGKTKLQEYYGVNVTAIYIADPELPEALKQAAVEREVMQKTILTRELERANLREMQKLDQDNIRRMARELVDEAKKRGSNLSFEVAMELILINLGKVKKENKQYGLSVDTLNAVKDVLPALVRELKGGPK